ncbi:MAG: hypothetical protein M1826_000649 [Phylliscum demangeonii]|nr:MAG: hypothetical protein M1826_000649 [Phylliscum demangeonii]
MAPTRALPDATNFMLVPANSPSYKDLVETRCLTRASGLEKHGPHGKSHASKSKHADTFDYVHLRAPLPPALTDGELLQGQSLESYFLMRRSSDGYVNATGMFKVAFPWATQPEEDQERAYLKTLPETSREETVGNLWVDPVLALQLAEEYAMGDWIRAMLDPTPVEKSASDAKTAIAAPPPFHMPPSATPKPGRGRGRLRSSSPGKSAAPPKKAATPRKRTNKAAASDAVAAVVPARLSTTTEVPEPAHEPTHKEAVHVELDASVETNGDVETEYSRVKIDLESDQLEAPVAVVRPEASDVQMMLAEARKMVHEAAQHEGKDARGKSKRKADEMFEDEDEDEVTTEELDDSRLDLALVRPIKRAHILEVRLKKEKVKSRALLGLVTTLAIGAVIPYVL